MTKTDCGKYWRHPSQSNKMSLWFKIKHNWSYYWRYQAYKGTVNFVKGEEGLMMQELKLLEVNPNHYYKNNILTSIENHKKSIIFGNNKLNNYPIIFKLYKFLGL